MTKGISALVSTILLILITISAIIIIRYGIMPKITEMQKITQNQTAKNQTYIYTEYVCKSNCEELGLIFHKLLHDIQYNNQGSIFGCYCKSLNGYGNIVVRIW